MLKSWKYMFAAAASAVLLTGCVSEQPSDISLDELEARVAQAMDPAGDYRKANAYYQRQNVVEECFWEDKHQLVEVRFQRPDKFKFSYFEKNAPITEILSTDGKAWMINYKENTINEITGEALEKFKVMLSLGHPDTDYDKLFAKVDTVIVRQSGTDYYKLTCHPRLANANPIIIYIDKNEYLPRRMELTIKHPDGDIESVSTIVEYLQFGNVKLPMLTQVTEGFREYTTRVVGYQINAQFAPEVFQKPKFDPVLIEMQKQRSRRR